MSEYKKLLKEMKDKVQASGSSRHSKQDYISVAQTLLNTPDHEVDVYMRDGGEKVTTNPVARYRDTLKPVLQHFGVDKAEAEKMDTVTFTKDHAEALMDVATQVIKDYTGTGRKLILPITAEDESQMEISQTQIKEKMEDTRKPEVQPDGTYKSVPTGERKTTKAHREMRCTNKVPGWLVSKEKI